MSSFRRVGLSIALILCFATTGALTGCPYSYDHVKLLARKGLGPSGPFRTNDLWGWTDSRDGTEYAIVGIWGGVAFVDLSNPRKPVNVGILKSHTFGSIWADIRVYKNHAFIVRDAAGAHGMQVFDLTQLRDVVDRPAEFEATSHYDGFEYAHNIAINEDSGFAYAVGTNKCNGGLHMINVQNPRSPTYAECYSGSGYIHDVQCVNYKGPDGDFTDHEICFAARPYRKKGTRYACFTYFNRDENKLLIVDVTDKNAPKLLSEIAYGGWCAHQGWLTDDSYHFLMGDEKDEEKDHHNTRTYIFNVKDLEHPKVLEPFTSLFSPAIDHNLYVRGKYVYEANLTSGLRILHINNLEKSDLCEVAYFDTYKGGDPVLTAGAWGAYPFFESGIVIVSDFSGGLFVLEPQLDGAPCRSPEES